MQQQDQSWIRPSLDGEGVLSFQSALVARRAEARWSGLRPGSAALPGVQPAEAPLAATTLSGQNLAQSNLRLLRELLKLATPA
jgi:hypothetical protein